jgi:hypothetical protein
MPCKHDKHAHPTKRSSSITSMRLACWMSIMLSQSCPTPLCWLVRAPPWRTRAGRSSEGTNAMHTATSTVFRGTPPMSMSRNQKLA